MKLIPLPAFADNYIWMLHDGHRALVVDPGDSAPVIQALASENLRLETILVTHHHADHTAGIAFLRESTQATVFGPAMEAIPEPYHALLGGETIHALGMAWQIFSIPGHTKGHLAYYVPESSLPPILFCGDTLFSAGCGRLFEGTAAQMESSLATLAALPDATLVCCAHEYTTSNLRFALELEPDNNALTEYAAHCARLRAAGLPTLPSTMDTERRINPFLRTDQPSIRKAAHLFDPDGFAKAGCFATLRQWKNEYR